MEIINNPNFKYGALIGMTQTVIGYPFDTIKTMKQSNNTTNINTNTYTNINTNTNFKPLNLKRLYQGVRFPMYMSIGFNSGVFGLYSTFLNYGYSRESSGFLAGGIMAIVSNPFEYYKVNSQVGQKFQYSNMWKGVSYTFWRESIATGFYFSNYHLLTTNFALSPFIAGGISGCLSWTITYPIDTLKTIKQSNDTLELRQIFTMIKKKQIKIWNGFFTCQIRAFIVNGVSFVMYEYLNV